MADFRAVPVPSAMMKLPRDKHGHPVPWFVRFTDGTPDFRVIGENKVPDAVKYNLCWVCGQPRGAYMAFVLGPMCALNRTCAEPPSHRTCAVYSALACPFLTTPHMRRRESGLPEDYVDVDGMITRNPGVTLVWVTRSFTPMNTTGATGPVPQRHLLFRVGPAVEQLWFAQGRTATKEEISASIESGIPILRAEAQRDGPRALEELERLHRDFNTALAERGPS